MTRWNRADAPRNNCTQSPYAHAHMLKSHLQMEKWKPAGQPDLRYSHQLSPLAPHMSKITFVINLSSSSHALGNQLHGWTPPSNLNNNLISYRRTVTQFTHLHLAARTLSVRTQKVLHTLEYGTPDSLTSLVMKAVKMWSNENSVSVKCIVYDWVYCVFLSDTMPYGLHLHLSPTDNIHHQKEKNPGGFFRGMGNIFCEMCCIQNTAYFQCSSLCCISGFFF